MPAAEIAPASPDPATGQDKHNNGQTDKAAQQKPAQDKTAHTDQSDTDTQEDDDVAFVNASDNVPVKQKPEPLPENKPTLLSPEIALPLNDKTFYYVTQEEFCKWFDLYPAVDVMQQLRNMIGWLDSNPTRRKTRTGIRKFITGWLAKHQNNPAHTPQNNDHYANIPGQPATPTEYQRNMQERRLMAQVYRENKKRLEELKTNGTKTNAETGVYDTTATPIARPVASSTAGTDTSPSTGATVF